MWARPSLRWPAQHLRALVLLLLTAADPSAMAQQRVWSSPVALSGQQLFPNDQGHTAATARVPVACGPRPVLPLYLTFSLEHSRAAQLPGSDSRLAVVAVVDDSSGREGEEGGGEVAARALGAAEVAALSLLRQHSSGNTTWLQQLNATTATGGELPVQLLTPRLGSEAGPAAAPLLLFYRRDWWERLAAAADSGSVRNSSSSSWLPPTWPLLVQLLRQLVNRDLDGDGAPDHVLCADFMPGCKGGPLLAAVFASLTQTHGTRQGFWFNTTDLSPAIGGPAMQSALQVYTALAASNAAPFTPGGAAVSRSNVTVTPDELAAGGGAVDPASGAPLCGAVNPLFAAGRCLFTIDWATAALRLTRSHAPGVRARLGVAQLPGSSQVQSTLGVPGESARRSLLAATPPGQVADSAQSGDATGLGTCTRSTCPTAEDPEPAWQAAVATVVQASGGSPLPPAPAASPSPLLVNRAPFVGEASNVWLLSPNQSLLQLARISEFTRLVAFGLDLKYAVLANSTQGLCDVGVRQLGMLFDAAGGPDIASALGLEPQQLASLRDVGEKAVAAAATCSAGCAGLLPFLSAAVVASVGDVSSSAGVASSSSSGLQAESLLDLDASDLAAVRQAISDALAHPNAALDITMPYSSQYRRVLDELASGALIAAAGARARNASASSSSGSRELLATYASAFEVEVLAPLSVAAAGAFEQIQHAFPYPGILLQLYWHAIGFEPDHRTANDTDPGGVGAIPRDGSGDSKRAALRVGLPIAVSIGGALLMGVLVLALCYAYGPRGSAGRSKRLRFRAARPPGAGPATTLVMTDVQNSTLLWEILPPDVMDTCLSIHHVAMRQAIAANAGHEAFTEGDAFAVAFHGPDDALGFAMDVQLALLDADWPRQLLEQPDGCEVWVVRRTPLQQQQQQAPPSPFGRAPSSRPQSGMMVVAEGNDQGPIIHASSTLMGGDSIGAPVPFSTSNAVAAAAGAATVIISTAGVPDCPSDTHARNSLPLAPAAAGSRRRLLRWQSEPRHSSVFSQSGSHQALAGFSLTGVFSQDGGRPSQNHPHQHQQVSLTGGGAVPTDGSFLLTKRGVGARPRVTSWEGSAFTAAAVIAGSDDRTSGGIRPPPPAPEVVITTAATKWTNVVALAAAAAAGAAAGQGMETVVTAAGGAAPPQRDAPFHRQAYSCLEGSSSYPDGSRDPSNDRKAFANPSAGRVSQRSMQLQGPAVVPEEGEGEEEEVDAKASAAAAMDKGDADGDNGANPERGSCFSDAAAAAKALGTTGLDPIRVHVEEEDDGANSGDALLFHGGTGGGGGGGIRDDTSNEYLDAEWQSLVTWDAAPANAPILMPGYGGAERVALVGAPVTSGGGSGGGARPVVGGLGQAGRMLINANRMGRAMLRSTTLPQRGSGEPTSLAERSPAAVAHHNHHQQLYELQERPSLPFAGMFSGGGGGGHPTALTRNHASGGSVTGAMAFTASGGGGHVGSGGAVRAAAGSFLDSDMSRYGVGRLQLNESIRERDRDREGSGGRASNYGTTLASVEPPPPNSLRRLLVKLSTKWPSGLRRGGGGAHSPPGQAHPGHSPAGARTASASGAGFAQQQMLQQLQLLQMQSQQQHQQRGGAQASWASSGWQSMQARAGGRTSVDRQQQQLQQQQQIAASRYGTEHRQLLHMQAQMQLLSPTSSAEAQYQQQQLLLMQQQQQQHQRYMSQYPYQEKQGSPLQVRGSDRASRSQPPPLQQQTQMLQILNMMKPLTSTERRQQQQMAQQQQRQLSQQASARISNASIASVAMQLMQQQPMPPSVVADASAATAATAAAAAGIPTAAQGVDVEAGGGGGLPAPPLVANASWRAPPPMMVSPIAEVGLGTAAGRSTTDPGIVGQLFAALWSDLNAAATARLGDTGAVTGSATGAAASKRDDKEKSSDGGGGAVGARVGAITAVTAAASSAACTIAAALRTLYERLRNEEVAAMLKSARSDVGGGDRPSGSKTPRFVRRLSISGASAAAPAPEPPVMAFRGLRVRVGLHSGPRTHEVVTMMKDGVALSSYTGDFLMIAKEISDAAVGGVVVLSGPAFRALQQQLRQGVAGGVADCTMVLHLGEHVIKEPQLERDSGATQSGGRNALDPGNYGMPPPSAPTREIYAAVFPGLAPRLALLPSLVRTAAEVVPGCLSAPAGLVAPVFCNVVGVEALLAWESLVQERLMRAAAQASVAAGMAGCRPLDAAVPGSVPPAAAGGVGSSMFGLGGMGSVFGLGGAGSVLLGGGDSSGVGMVRAALELLCDVAQETASRHGGYVVASSADGGHWVLVFGSAEAAVLWGLEMLEAMLQAAWPDGFLDHELTEEMWEGGRLLKRGLRLRIGIDYGRAMVRLVPRSGRLDYVGRPMNRAARIAAKAKAATVLASGAAWDAARPALGPSVSASNLGSMQLKGVREHMELWALRGRGGEGGSGAPDGG